jgi:hypothetical protein
MFHDSVQLQVPAKGVAEGDKARLQEAMAGMFVKGETQDMNNTQQTEVGRAQPNQRQQGFYLVHDRLEAVCARANEKGGLLH